MTSREAPLLEVTQLHLLNLPPISIHLERGEAIAITGPSGVGKSLFLLALADMIPARGKVTLLGQERNAIPAPQWRHSVALVPARSYWWSDRISDHFPSDATVEQIDILLEELMLPSGIIDRSVTTVSSGEQQRLALLRTLLRQPKVLLLDEPTAHLDRNSQRGIEQTLKRYRLSKHVGQIWVTHDVTQAERVAEHHYKLVPTGLLPQ